MDHFLVPLDSGYVKHWNSWIFHFINHPLSNSWNDLPILWFMKWTIFWYLGIRCVSKTGIFMNFPFYTPPIEQQFEWFTPYFGLWNGQSSGTSGFGVFQKLEFMNFPFYKPPIEQQLKWFTHTLVYEMDNLLVPRDSVCFKNWNFHEFSILYTTHRATVRMIYPILWFMKWTIFWYLGIRCISINGIFHFIKRLRPPTSEKSLISTRCF